MFPSAFWPHQTYDNGLLRVNMFCYTTWWAWNDERLPLFECAGCITVQQWNRPAHPHLSSHRGAGEAEGSKISEGRWESSAQRWSPGWGAGRILHIRVTIERDASSPASPPKQEKYYFEISPCDKVWGFLLNMWVRKTVSLFTLASAQSWGVFKRYKMLWRNLQLLIQAAVYVFICIWNWPADKMDVCEMYDNTTDRTFLHVFTSQHMTGMTANICISLQTLCAS